MSAVATAKRWYAAAAGGTGRGLARAGLLPAEPPPRVRRARHWAYSLTRVRDPLALVELDTPWWTYAAVDAVEHWMASRASPPCVLEWGAGASTVWLAKRAASVHSIEHDAAFAAALAPLLPAIVELTVVAPEASAAPSVASGKEGHGGLDFTAYVHAADGLGPFDLVVVDGRARGDCLTAALPVLAADGLVVFDNSRRRRYRDAIARAVAAGFSERVLRGLTPTLPYPEQTSLLARGS